MKYVSLGIVVVAIILLISGCSVISDDWANAWRY